MRLLRLASFAIDELDPCGCSLTGPTGAMGAAAALRLLLVASDGIEGDGSTDCCVDWKWGAGWWSGVIAMVCGECQSLPSYASHSIHIPLIPVTSAFWTYWAMHMGGDEGAEGRAAQQAGTIRPCGPAHVGAWVAVVEKVGGPGVLRGETNMSRTGSPPCQRYRCSSPSSSPTARPQSQAGTPGKRVGCIEGSAAHAERGERRAKRTCAT